MTMDSNTHGNQDCARISLSSDGESKANVPVKSSVLLRHA